MKLLKHPVLKRSASVVLATFALVANQVPASAAQLVEPSTNDQLETTEDSGLNIIDVLANDAPEAVITSYTQGTLGEVGEVKNSQGTIIQLTYTPAADANGSDEFTYTATTDGGEVVSTVAVTIAAVADAPAAGDDDLPLAGEIVENSPAIDVTADLLANDSDADNDPPNSSLSIVSITPAASGTVALVNGVVTYEPTSDKATSDSFSYTISDGDEATADATGSVSVTIVPVDDAPTAVADDQNVVDEGGSVNIDVLANDEDVDGGELAVASISAPDHGTAAWSAEAGAIVYTHDDTENTLTDSFSYTLNGGSEATVSVAITPVDDAPTATDDDATAAEGASVTIAVLNNDPDLDGGDKIVASISEAPSIGTAVISQDASSIVYTHTGDTLGEVPFKYTVNGGSEATVNVTVTNSDDDPPVVDPPATLEILEDASATPIPVLTDGQTDADGSVLSIASIGTAAHGTAKLVEGTVTYTPNADFFGEDSFTIVVTDGDGGNDDLTLTANVTVASVNDAPVAKDDFYTGESEPFCIECGPIQIGGHFDGAVQEDTPTTLRLLDNDSDIDSQTLSVDPESLSLDTAIGTLEVVQGGVLYTPAENYFGEFEFTYRIMDGPAAGEDTLFSKTASVTVEVKNLEDPLVAVVDEATVAEDGVINVDVQANDIDVDRTGFGLVDVSQPAGGFAAVAGDKVRVQPDPNFSGTLEIEYTIRADFPVDDRFFGPGTSCDVPFFFEAEGAIPGCELVTGVLFVEVVGVNDQPEAAQDEATTDEDTPVTIDVLGNDTDADVDALSIDRTTQGRIGSVEIVDGKVVYTPDENANGSDSFIYYATDGDLLSVALVSVEITPVNDDPTIEGRKLLIDEDSDARFVVSIDDIDSETLTVSLSTEPVEGSVSIEGTSIIYTPPINFFGEVGFGLTVSDDAGGSSAGEFTVTVASVNDEPVAEDLAIELDEDTSAPGTIDVTDVEQTDDQLLTEIGTEPTLGTVALTGTSFVYTPDADANGEDSFTVVLTDLDGASVTSTVSVNIIPVNDAPEIEGQSVETDEDTSVEINVVATDVDKDDLTLGVETESANGDVEIDGMTVTFTPAPDWHGETTFDLNVTDTPPGNDSQLARLVLAEPAAVATFTITVASVNDEPTISAETLVLDEDTSGTVEVATSDIEDDFAKIELVVSIGDQGSKGTAEIVEGSVVYTPDADENGDDEFELIVTDSDGASVSTMAQVSITPVNDDPTAAACEPMSVLNNVEIEFDPSVCGSDIDGDELTVVEESVEATNGTATVTDGMVVFTPSAGFVGDAGVQFLLSDGEGEPAESSIQLEVTSPYVGVGGKDGQLVRIYSAMLGRLPDDLGFAYWTEMMDNGVHLSDLVTYFGTSDEFANTYGDRLLEDTNEEWIEFVYGEILDRSSDEEGKAYYLGLLDSGEATREEIVVFFAESEEYKQKTQTG